MFIMQTQARSGMSIWTQPARRMPDDKNALLCTDVVGCEEAKEELQEIVQF